MEENNTNPYGRTLGVFDYHTNKLKFEKGLDKCRYAFFGKKCVLKSIGDTLLPIGFLLGLGGLSVLSLHVLDNTAYEKYSLFSLIIPGIIFALGIVFKIAGGVKDSVINSQFNTYKDREMEYIPQTPFIVRVFVYETGVYFAVTEKFNGYMPYAGEFKYTENAYHDNVLLGSIETKIFLGIGYKEITPEALRIIRLASNYNLVED